MKFIIGCAIITLVFVVILRFTLRARVNAQEWKLQKCKNPETAKAQCFKASDGTDMTTQTDNNAVLANTGKQAWAAKQVKKCPANGNAAACKAPEHAVMPDGTPGCAKADVKHAAEAKANIPMPLQDTVVEEDYFIATTGN
jgi:hypothetical protein